MGTEQSKQNGQNDNNEQSKQNENNAKKQDEDKNDNQTPAEKGTKESFYDKIPITKKQLDIIIAILFAALIIFLVFGTLIGNRII